MWPFAALTALALWSAGRGGEAAAGEPRAEVSKPIDVTIESYNFNTSVRWNYQNRSSKLLFVVEQCCYGDTWIEVSNCVNISQHYCDLTYKIEHCNSFWVRVKALDGLHKSDYTTSEMFTVIRDGKIGPPKLSLSIIDDEILVNIENPLTPYHRKHQLSITENFTDFTYNVFLWKNGSSEEVSTFELERCPRRKCFKSLHVPSWDASYCVSAQGFSVDYDVKGEESKESCISFPPKHSSESTVLIIVGVLVPFFAIVALVIVYVCLPKKKIKLPKSLASVVRSQVNSNFDIKPEGKYISIVTSSADKMVSPESEDENTVDPIGFITKDKTVDLSNSGNTVADGSEDTSDGAVEINIEEGLVVEVSGGNPDPEDNYSKSVGGQEDTCNNLSILCPDVQQPGVAKSSRNIGGYDKPHWQDTHPEAESLVT